MAGRMGGARRTVQSVWLYKVPSTTCLTWTACARFANSAMLDTDQLTRCLVIHNYADSVERLLPRPSSSG